MSDWTKHETHQGARPVHVLAVVDHLEQLLLTNVLHHHHGTDSEDVREAKVDDAVGWMAVSPWTSTNRGFPQERGARRL